MAPNLILFAWNRSLPGRESLSAQHFQDFGKYLASQNAAGVITGFEPVFLEPNAGTTNGFFLIRGEPGKLAQLTGSPEWAQHQARAMMHLEGLQLLRGVSGAAVQEQMAIWTNAIPKH